MWEKSASCSFPWKCEGKQSGLVLQGGAQLIPEGCSVALEAFQLPNYKILQIASTLYDSRRAGALRLLGLIGAEDGPMSLGLVPPRR